jgi:hypothetical protein
VAGLGVVQVGPDHRARRRHYLAVLRPARKPDGPPITVRVIEYTVHSRVAGSDDEDTSEVFALVTDLLDPETHPALDLACAYPMRWECETVIGHHKTDMGQGMAVLRSKDPEGVAQEMWALFAVYQAIHTLIGAAVDAAGIPPDQIRGLPQRAGVLERRCRGRASGIVGFGAGWVGGSGTGFGVVRRRVRG